MLMPTVHLLCTAAWQWQAATSLAADQPPGQREQQSLKPFLPLQFQTQFTVHTDCRKNEG